jgi:hypothetical protein
MSTPTPRTDAVQFKDRSDYHDPSAFDWFVRADFARTLERELHESRNAEMLARVQLGNEREKVNWLLGYEGVDWIISAHACRWLKESDSENRQLLDAAMKADDK